RSTGTERLAGPTSTSSPAWPRAACASSPPAACARRRTSTRSPPRAPRPSSWAVPCSSLRRNELEIRFERRQGEAVRRRPPGEEVRRDDAVRLLAVALPERPAHRLQ